MLSILIQVADTLIHLSYVASMLLSKPTSLRPQESTNVWREESIVVVPDTMTVADQSELGKREEVARGGLLLRSI